MQELANVYNLTSSVQDYLPQYRLLAILESFLGSPYSSENNLNTYSFKHFDCVTLVEVALALLLVKDFSSLANFAVDFVDQLMKLRYFDPVHDTIVRNHFITLDLLANRKDLLQDITAEIYQTKTSVTVIDKAAWFAKTQGLKKLAFTPMTVKVPYITNLDLLNNYEQLRKYFPPISINLELIWMFLI
jgi:hypothetical protein